jgi:hypothetical protein
MKLTEDRVLKLECPAGKKDVLVFDEVQRGLAIRVTSSGGKTYLCQYTFGGAKRRIPLGAPTLALARSAAAKVIGEVAQGLDPAAERKAAALLTKEKAAAAALTLGLLIDRWEAGHLAGRRPGYAAEATRALRFAFRLHLKSPAAALTPKAARATLRTFHANAFLVAKPGRLWRSRSIAAICQLTADLAAT